MADRYDLKGLGDVGTDGNALAQSTTEELVEELLMRHSAGVVVLLTDRGAREEKAAWWGGGRYTCIGLLHTVLRNVEAQLEDDDDGEDA